MHKPAPDFCIYHKSKRIPNQTKNKGHMGKKTKLPFLSKSSSGVQAKSSWPWPSCHQPRTLSFRTDDGLFKTINSAYLDTIIEAETPESWFSNSSESVSFSTASDDESGGDPVETVIRGLRSDRLFFEPGETSSILEEAKPGPDELPFKESVVLSMESQDPYADFRKSMEEMVEAHGLINWEILEELLCWYLRANGKSNHGYILCAFVDLLLKLAVSSPCIPSCSNCSNSPSSLLSFYTSSSSSDDSSTTTPCVSSLEAEEEIDNTNCVSSLSEAEKVIIKDNHDAASSFN